MSVKEQMNIHELIRLADFLDNKGEHEAANEIDELISTAISEDERRDWAEGMGEEGLSGPLNMLEDEIMSIINKYMGDLSPEEIARVLGSQADMIKSKASVTKNAGLWDDLEEDTEELNEKYEPEINPKEKEGFKELIEKSKMLKGSLKKEDYENLMASLYDMYFKKFGEEADVEMDAEDDLEPERMWKMLENEPMDDMDKQKHSYYKKMVDDNFLKVLIGLKSLKEIIGPKEMSAMLDSMKSEMDNLVSKESQFTEDKEIITSNTLNDAFGKLADLADTLDKNGITKGADLIDEFLNKYAEEESFPGLEEDSDEDERELDELEDEELEKTQQDWEAAKKEFEWKESAAKHRLSKRADPVRETKEEDSKSEQSKRYDSKHHHNLQIREPKRDQEKVDREGRDEHHVSTYKHTDVHALSTRYCPEHIGDQLGRIGEGIYQCSRDGAIFNWETGWTDSEGNQHPGGSVAAQTPDSSGYEIPHRIFDSREKTLNVVN